MNARRVFFGDASRPAGNDDAADAGQLVRGRIDRKDVTLNAELANTPRQQVAVLPARIQNRNTLHERIIAWGARLFFAEERFHALLRLHGRALLRERLDGQ